MKRGEIWWAALPGPAGVRPVALVSRDKAYAIRTMVTVAQLTTKIRNLPVEVLLGPGDGLAKKCVINADTLQTVDKTCLRNRITSLSFYKTRELNEAIRFALGLPRFA